MQFSQLQMILGFKIELRYWSLASGNFQIFLIVTTDRCCRIGHVRNHRQYSKHFFIEQIVFMLSNILLLSKFFSLLLKRLPLLWRRPLHLGVQVVCLTIEFFGFVQFGTSLGFRFNKSIQTRCGNAPMKAVCLHSVNVFQNKFSIKHSQSPLNFKHQHEGRVYRIR